MKNYLSNLIPRIKQYSKQLDNVSLLRDQHWVAIEENSNEKVVFIFRKNRELLISKDGNVKRGTWDIIGAESLIIDFENETRLFKHLFFDEHVLVTKIDGKNEYALFVNENKSNQGLKSIDAIYEFLNVKYKPLEGEYVNEEKKDFSTEIIIMVFVIMFLFIIMSIMSKG